MNDLIERILFCLVCIQIGMIYVNNIEIVPGIMLGTGELNNAWGGQLTNPSDAMNSLTYSLGTLDQVRITVTTYNSTPINLWLFSLTGDQAVLFHRIESLLGGIMPLLGLLFSLIGMFTSMLYMITIGSINFYTNIFKLISKDNAALFGVPIAILQITLVTYYLGKTVLEIFGAKSKSVGSGGTLGQ